VSPVRVLVVEDEASFVDALTVGLEREGFEVVAVADGGEALRRWEEIDPDVILLDVMLPTVSGVDVCRRIRSSSSVPIIMVTARSSEIDTVVGLEVGADDYVAKPYRLRELVARIRAVLRRRGGDDRGGGVPGDDAGEVVRVGDLVVDTARHEVTLAGRPLALPLKEFELLTLLAANVGRVLTREVLIDRVWGADYVGDTKTLDVHIKRLRAKIEADPRHPERIVTIRGLGYKLVEP